MATLYVKEPGARLGKQQERLVITKGTERLLEVPAIKVERVIIMGSGVQVSTAALTFLASRAVPVIYTNSSGTHHKAVLTAGMSNDGHLRLAQARLVDDRMRTLAVVRAVVAGKLLNQLAMLQHRRSAWRAPASRAVDVIQNAHDKALGALDVDQARGYEGIAAAAYWRAWAEANPGWQFAGRQYHPPPDPINALLGFGYTLLLNDVLTAVHAVGLDPALGFFHSIQAVRPALALDLEEEFRVPVVDDLVLHWLDDGLKPADFERPAHRPGATYLSSGARIRFIHLYEQQVARRILYPRDHYGRQDHRGQPPKRETWRHAILLQAQLFARSVLSVQDPYLPLVWPRDATQERDQTLPQAGHQSMYE